MTDILLFWRDYRKNTERPVWFWHSNSQQFAKLQPGDRIWFVTSGKNLRLAEEEEGYLVMVWSVEQIIGNPGDDPTYPRDRFAYRVLPKISEICFLEEPINVDHLVRPQSSNPGAIGRYLQSPRKLKSALVEELLVLAGPQMAKCRSDAGD